MLLLPCNQILNTTALLYGERGDIPQKREQGRFPVQFMCFPPISSGKNIIGLEQELLLLIHLPLTHASLPQPLFQRRGERPSNAPQLFSHAK